MKKLIILSIFLFLKNAFADSSQFSSFRADSSYSFTEINSTDSTGGKLRVLANSNPSFSISIAEHWNSSNTSFIKFNYSSILFNKPEGIEMENLNQNLISFGAGHTFSLLNDTRFSSSLLFSEEIYVRSKSSTILTIDKFLNPQLRLEAEKDLFSLKNLDFGLNGNIEVSAPFTAERYESTEGNYSVDPALSYGGFIYGRKFFNSFSLEGSIFFKVKNSKTSITDQTIVNQGVSLRFALPFGY